jgi:hypothetical protein
MNSVAKVRSSPSSVDGWPTGVGLSRPDVGWTDVLASLGEDRLMADAKGIASAPDLDVDTLYGQLLPRMTMQPRTRSAVVVPENLIPTAARVSADIRERLGIELYGIWS